MTVLGALLPSHALVGASPVVKPPAVSYSTGPRQTKPILRISRRIWLKLMEYVCQCNEEINGFAFVKQLTPSMFTISTPDDVFITHQEVTMGSADVTALTFALASEEAGRQRRNSELRFQWHSHVNMSPSPSVTDTGTRDSYGPAGIPWMISMILNKKGEYTAYMDVFHPVRVETEVTLDIYDEVPVAMREAVAEEIEDKVVFKKPIVVVWKGPKKDDDNDEPESSDPDQIESLADFIARWPDEEWDRDRAFALISS